MAFDTKLSPTEEKQYQLWMKRNGQTKENGQNVDNALTGIDYDYRGFFRKNGAVNVKLGQHFTDEFKKPNHPTFSNESQYSTPQNPGGTWIGEQFVPHLAMDNRLGNIGIGSNLPFIRK